MYPFGLVRVFFKAVMEHSSLRNTKEVSLGTYLTCMCLRCVTEMRWQHRCSLASCIPASLHFCCYVTDSTEMTFFFFIVNVMKQSRLIYSGLGGLRLSPVADSCSQGRKVEKQSPEAWRPQDPLIMESPDPSQLSQGRRQRARKEDTRI